MIYTTGTIAISGSTLTGTGTNFTASGSLIRVGCTVIAMSNPVQVFQITAVGSATSLSVTPAASPALAAGTKFAILLSDSLSVDGLAQDIAETFTLYQKNISGFADVMNGSADVTITINGVAVTVPGQQSLAKKGANKDITSLSGLTTALSIEQGGTGGKDAITARTKLEVVYQRDAAIGPGENLNSYNSSMAGEFRCSTDTNATQANNYPIKESGSLKVYKTLTGSSALSCVQEYRTYYSNRLFMRRLQMPGDSWSAWAEFYSTSNTTVDSNGFIKKASPIIKVFGDGKCETNDESEGVTVNRVSEGVYHITECLGLNSDLAWGGVAGGIEVPKDINGQPQIWVDYDVESDGSITLKTYHREHANAPEFARNIVDGYSDGSPRDIPVGVFVSLRVEMSSDSKYNIAIRKAEIAMKVKNYIDNNNAELAAMPMMLK